MSSQPFLSVMHAKAHSWHCQVGYFFNYCKVLITRTGIMGWKPNSAAGAGEEMEQLFSCFNLTTKYMNAAGV